VCPNIVERPSIDEVSPCCQGSVDSSVDYVDTWAPKSDSRVYNFMLKCLFSSKSMLRDFTEPSPSILRSFSEVTGDYSYNMRLIDLRTSRTGRIRLS
jgi:hypothetical protein